MLFVVATPIGNLEDVSERALRVLEEVDLILCEDTRRTGKLLHHFGIGTPTESYHQHSGRDKMERALNLVRGGKRLALVSDAGMPGISDPGGRLVEFLVERMPQLDVVPVPGPSALTAALSVSGFPADSFLFLGFPPKKRKRDHFFERVAEAEETVVFYESPHRLLKTVKELSRVAGEGRLVVGQELTKMHETIYRGSVDEVLEKLQNGTIKGEFVLVLDRKG